MEFKIDTKPSYTVITPVSNDIDANLTDAIRQKWNELTRSGSQNLIVDLHNCIKSDESAFSDIQKLHEDLYNSNQSLVFINMPSDFIAGNKEDEDLPFNIAPTMNEAIDIISMEILERDLFDEEA